jgi:hypothetical protein
LLISCLRQASDLPPLYPLGTRPSASITPSKVSSPDSLQALL